MSSSPNPTSRFGWPLAFTVMFLALLVAGIFIAREVKKGLRKVQDGLRPQIVINEQVVINTAMSELKRTAKLVVLSAKVRVLVEAQNDKIIEIPNPFGEKLKISAGTTKVLLRADDNKVQFVIPFDAVTAANFRYDPALNRLTVTLPHPKVDPEIVELMQNPEVRIEAGWARLQEQSGKHLLEQAKQNLRFAVLNEAMSPVYLGAARDAGREAAMKLLENAVVNLPGNVHLQIEFEEPPRPPAPG